MKGSVALNADVNMKGGAALNANANMREVDWALVP